MRKQTLPGGSLVRTTFVLVVLGCTSAVSNRCEATASVPWKRHTIDASSRGADGVRLADTNGDGLSDFVTGWEQGGVTRIYRHPGFEDVRGPWPSVSVGSTPDCEDAVFVDLDGDGLLDVLAACEGETRSLFVQWAPASQFDYLNPSAWKQGIIPASSGVMKWMFSLPMDVDGRNGVDFFSGGRGEGAMLGWFESPPDPHRLEEWKWHPMRSLGWLMSLEAADMNGDGLVDVVFTDRRGDRTGAFWLQNPGAVDAAYTPWKEHPIGALDTEALFLAIGDIDGDQLTDVVVATAGNEIILIRRLDATGLNWKSRIIAAPADVGSPKAVSVGDVDMDGRADVVVTSEHADNPRTGVYWLSFPDPAGDSPGEFHDISGSEGTKFDLVQLLDLDGDGDLDVLTCEERENLGVFWYENPGPAALRR